MADPTPDDKGPARTEMSPRSPTGMPRWVKVFLIIAIVFVLLGVVVLVTGGGGPRGGHGPGRHAPPGLGAPAPASAGL